MNPENTPWKAWETAETALGRYVEAVSTSSLADAHDTVETAREAVASTRLEGLATDLEALYRNGLEGVTGYTPAETTAFDLWRAGQTVARLAEEARDGNVDLPDEADLESIARRSTLASKGRDSWRPAGQGGDWRRIWMVRAAEAQPQQADKPGLIRIAETVAAFVLEDAYGEDTPRMARLLAALLPALAGKFPGALWVSAGLAEGARRRGRRLAEMFGDEWIRLYLEAVAITADAGRQRLRTLETERQVMAERCPPKRITSRIDRAFDFIAGAPVFTIRELARVTEISVPFANRQVAQLKDAGVVEELTGRTRFRIYGAPRLLA